MVVAGALLAVYTASQIRIGNPVEGTNLLWEDSDFNTAVRAINDHFPGVNTLEIVLEAKNPKTEAWNVSRASTVMTMLDLQRLLEASDPPPRATLSFNDYLRESNRLFQGGSPTWLPLDDRDRNPEKLAFVDVTRDDLLTFAASLIYQLSPTADLTYALTYRHQDSNDPRLDFIDMVNQLNLSINF